MASEATQQPVNLTVTATGAPIRAGSYPGPYRIINQSLSATIWVSDNPSCAPNAGTSVSPGTSLQWVKSGDLYIILGNDPETITAGKADVILSYDVSDWQPNPVAIATAVLNSGIIVLDKQETLWPYSPYPPGSTQRFDVTTFATLHMRFAFMDAASYLTVVWYDVNGEYLANQSFSGSNTISNYGLWSGSLPVIGSYCEINVIGQANVLLVASTRPSSKIRQMLGTSLSNGSVVLAPGLNDSSVPFGPWIGPMWVNVSCSAPAVTNIGTRVSIQDTAGGTLWYGTFLVPAGGPYSVQNASIGSAGVVQGLCYGYGGTYRLSMNNADAGNKTFNWTITPGEMQ